MAKILISSLGRGKETKGKYSDANYRIENEIYYEEKFIANALTKHFKIDKNIILGTSGSIWEVFYENLMESPDEVDGTFQLDLLEKSFANNIDKIDLKNLEEKLGNKVKCFLIEFGKNDEELIKNFHIIMGIMDKLEKGDEIYIDITHSFRSLSLYMFIILNYLQNISNKNIQIQYISYGMMEATDENKITPVINLNLLYRAIEWIKAASDFKKFGDSEGICKLLPNEFEKSKSKLLGFSDALSLSYVNELKDKIKILYDSFNDFKKIDGFGKFIIPDVIEDITGRYKTYYKSKLESDFLLATSKLFYDYKVYSSAYIFLQEAMVIYFAEFSCKENNIENNKKIKATLEYEQFHSSDEWKKLSKLYKKLKMIRNSLAHAIDIGYKSSIDNLNYVKDFEKEFYIPIKEILNKNIDFKIFE